MYSFFYQGHLGSPLFCRPPYVKENKDYFEFIGIAISQAGISPFLGEETPEETLTPGDTPHTASRPASAADHPPG